MPIDIDPYKLKEFTNDLRSFNQHLAAKTSLLKASKGKLKEAWKDEKFVKFSKEFDKAMNGIEEFQKQFKKKEPELRRFADDLISIYKKLP